MTNAAGHGTAVPETEALLQRVSGMIAGARALPLSSSVKLDNKDEILELLREAVERLPEELREARWMLREREEYLAATQRRADELVEAARSEAQRLVQRTEIIKEAQAQARRLLEEAREEASRMRLEAEDYADQKLAQFEIVLERTLKTVASGRQKLAGLPEKAGVTPGGEASGGRGEGDPGGPGGQTASPYDQSAGATQSRATGVGGLGSALAPGAGARASGESTHPGAFPRLEGSGLGGRGGRAGTPEKISEEAEAAKRLFDQDST
jgi:hypothetical protein